MRICSNCENSVWCSTFTEAKCIVKKRRINDLKREALRCKDFKKDTREEKPKCRCKHCLTLGVDNG